MAIGFRNPLGVSLQNSILPGDQPQMGMGDFTPGQGMKPKKPGFLAPGSKGAMIAGIIGDMLATASGGQAQAIPMMVQQRQREQDAAAADAQWTRRRMEGREDKQWEWQNKPQEVSVPPILRDAQAWAGMTDAQKEAYKQLQQIKPQFIPDGLGGGQWVTPGAPAAQQPAIGAVVPDPRKQGGPTPTASGDFR